MESYIHNGTIVAILLCVRLVFDHGTILVRDRSPSVALSDLPGVLWDSRVKAYRAPAYYHKALSAELLRRGIPFSDEVRSGRPLTGTWSAVELRPYQDAALCAWELARRRALIVLPTGSGKTRVAMAGIARSGVSALCLVPTRVLLDQWLRAVGGAYRGRIGCCGDGLRQIGEVTVATFESAYRYMGRLGSRFDLLVIDEAHHFGCGVRDEALEMSTAELRLGLTATPPREGAAVQRLAELIGPTAYELTIGDLAGGRKGLLPEALLPCSIRDNHVVPHFLTENDHPGCAPSSRNMPASPTGGSESSTNASVTRCPLPAREGNRGSPPMFLSGIGASAASPRSRPGRPGLRPSCKLPALMHGGMKCSLSSRRRSV